MQIKFLTLAMAALAIASPAAELEERGRKSLCPALYTPQCCQLDVEGVVDASCTSPPRNPKTKRAFKKACAKKKGSQAQCCTLPLLGQALLCHSP